MTLRDPASGRQGIGIALLAGVALTSAVLVGGGARPATASSRAQLAPHVALLAKPPAAQALGGRVVSANTDPSAATFTNELKTTGAPESADVTIDGFEEGGPWGAHVTMVFAPAASYAKYCTS